MGFALGLTVAALTFVGVALLRWPLASALLVLGGLSCAWSWRISFSDCCIINAVCAGKFPRPAARRTQPRSRPLAKRNCAVLAAARKHSRFAPKMQHFSPFLRCSDRLCLNLAAITR